MRPRFAACTIFLAAVLAVALCAAAAVSAQEQVVVQEGGPQGGDQGRKPPVFGKITALHANAMEVATPQGQTVTVKFTEKTQFRKDRQPAKHTDFKVGDVVIVRGDENPDHTWTAQIVAARTMTGENARIVQGTMGKDFVAGEVKSIDPPKLTLLRSDNVAQTIELNEDTSLRKGRESVTMADIQVGDHVIAHGAMQGGVFVPKNMAVFDPQQWERMQQRMREFGVTEQDGGGNGGKSGAPSQNPQAQNPPEPRH